MRWRTTLALLLLAAAAFAAQPAPPPLTLTFNDDSIAVGGVPPSHPVYLFGLARETRPYVTSLRPYEAKLTEAAGKVTYPFDKQRSRRSVWLAVDLASGAAVAGSPPDYAATALALDGKQLKKDPGGEVAQIVADGSMVQFIVVRPGVGVWGELAFSQGPLDDGTDNNKVSLSVFKLQPMGGTTEPAPKKLKKGDVVFVLDSFHAQYGVATVGE